MPLSKHHLLLLLYINSMENVQLSLVPRPPHSLCHLSREIFQVGNCNLGWSLLYDVQYQNTHAWHCVVYTQLTHSFKCFAHLH